MAKGGRGGGPKHGGFKGGGGRGGNFHRGGPPQWHKNHKHKHAGKGHSGKEHAGRYWHSPSRPTDRTDGNWWSPTQDHPRWPYQRSTFGQHPQDMQRLNEDRKLAHRRSIAEHLRRVADRNGNSNLYDVADRMEQKAEEHYQKRLAKIDEQANDWPWPDDGDLPDGDVAGHEPETGLPPADGTDGWPEEWADRIGRLTGRENALYRQLRNEERKLTQRMEAVEELRELAGLNGDSELLAAAQRLEETALSHYESRMGKIDEFRDRFGLPDLREVLPPPVAPQ